MCQLCNSKPVYEFTNQRKLCARCFANYFQKKFLYTLRKFGMIHPRDIVGYKKGNSLKKIVLEYLLKFASQKYGFQLVKLPDKKANKIVDDSSLDSESEKIVREIIEGNAVNLKKCLPVEERIIKPLYLFLDEEIMLYAKIKRLKFKEGKKRKDRIANFVDSLEEKHPEVKRAVVNSLLGMYKGNKKDL